MRNHKSRLLACLGYIGTVSIYPNGTELGTAICHTGSHMATINKQLRIHAHGRLTITVT